MCIGMFMLPALVKVRGQFVETGSVLSYGLQGLNSGLRAWQQVPLPTKPAKHI